MAAVEVELQQALLTEMPLAVVEETEDRQEQEALMEMREVREQPL